MDRTKEQILHDIESVIEKKESLGKIVEEIKNDAEKLFRKEKNSKLGKI